MSRIERHDDLAQLAELAAFQVLEADEQQRLAEHLEEGCESCLERYADGGRALDVFALAGPSVAPRPEAREALLASIGAEPWSPAARDAGERTRGGRWRAVLPALAAGVALLLATGSLLRTLGVERDAAAALRDARARIDATLEGLEERDARLEALALRVANFESALAAGGDAQARSVTLAGEAAFGAASARVVVDRRGNQVLLLASKLPPAPPDHVYQLWVVVSGAPRSLGTFDSDANGRALHVESESLQLTDDEFSIAISVEPAGGVPQPTGPIVLASH